MNNNYKLRFKVNETERPDYGDVVKDIITGYGSLDSITTKGNYNGSIEAPNLITLVSDYHDLASELEAYWANIKITGVTIT